MTSSKKKEWLWILIFFLSFLFSNKVIAGGGRFELQSYNSPGRTGTSGVNIQAWVFSQDHSRHIVGEKVEFRIDNPRPNDKCLTTRAVSDENGLVFGECFADEPGTLTVYAYSLDNGDRSSDYLLYFNDPPPTVTPSPRSAPSPTPRPSTFINPKPTDNAVSTISPSMTSVPIPTVLPMVETKKTSDGRQKALFLLIITVLFLSATVVIRERKL